jgi:DNA-binding NtrC family response regulator
MAKQSRILVAEDDRVTRQAWLELLKSWDFAVDAAEDGVRTLEKITAFEPHIVLLDLKMPRKDGLQVLSELSETGIRPYVIVISGEGDIPEAVKAVKLGAYDYLRKPIDPTHLQVLLHNLTAHLKVHEENERLRRRLMMAGELGSIIGHSPAMRRVMALIEQAAPSSASVIIRGESGTGKEIAARTLHELSPQRTGPYIAVNCAAMPETLMESELFGHERGAFTGAARRREGCFELANGGTLLLDEITEMKPELQAKLLRVIEEQKVRRLGGTAEIELDVRVLAASNRDLESAIAEGELRQDLYYRLNVLTVEIPPLRERPEDIAPLVEHFLRQLTAPNGKTVTGVNPECLQALQSYSWPGNVRQLRNVIERAMIITQGPEITVADLPNELRRVNPPSSCLEVPLGSSLEGVERDLILKTIDFAGGNKSKAAELLGISLKTLYNRLERYGVKPEPRVS